MLQINRFECPKQTDLCEWSPSNQGKDWTERKCEEIGWCGLVWKLRWPGCTEEFLILVSAASFYTTGWSPIKLESIKSKKLSYLSIQVQFHFNNIIIHQASLIIISWSLTIMTVCSRTTRRILVPELARLSNEAVYTIVSISKTIVLPVLCSEHLFNVDSYHLDIVAFLL